MLLQEVDPHRIVSALEPRSFERIRVDTSTETITLEAMSAILD